MYTFSIDDAKFSKNTEMLFLLNNEQHSTQRTDNTARS